LNTNIIIVNAPPHSWALMSCCATVQLDGKRELTEGRQMEGGGYWGYSYTFDWVQSGASTATLNKCAQSAQAALGPLGQI